MNKNEKLKESSSLSPREIGNQLEKTRQRMNNSGFFVFNEEDMKKMTRDESKEQ